MQQGWYKIKIFGTYVNWASVVASGVIFLGLELWRRQYIAKKVKKEVQKEIAQADLSQGGASEWLDDITDEIENLF